MCIRLLLLFVATIHVVTATATATATATDTATDWRPAWKLACFDSTTGAVLHERTPTGYCRAPLDGREACRYDDGMQQCIGQCVGLDNACVCIARPRDLGALTGPARRLHHLGTTASDATDDAAESNDVLTAADASRCLAITAGEWDGAVKGRDPKTVWQFACFTETTVNTTRRTLVPLLKPEGFCTTGPIKKASLGCQHNGAHCVKVGGTSPDEQINSCVSAQAEQRGLLYSAERRRAAGVFCAHMTALEVFARIRGWPL